MSGPGDSPLAARRCAPCEGGVPRLGEADIARLAPQVPAWRVVNGQRLARRLAFRDFAALMRCVNRMAEVAEAEGHHPDFSVHHSRLDVEIWTHAIGGLSENDFILAARLDGLWKDAATGETTPNRAAGPHGEAGDAVT